LSESDYNTNKGQPSLLPCMERGKLKKLERKMPGFPVYAADLYTTNSFFFLSSLPGHPPRILPRRRGRRTRRRQAAHRPAAPPRSRRRARRLLAHARVAGCVRCQTRLESKDASEARDADQKKRPPGEEEGSLFCLLWGC
jgi:hypothetical protein